MNNKEIANWSSCLDFFNRSKPEPCKSVSQKDSKSHTNFYFIVDCIQNKVIYTCDCFELVLGYAKDDYSILEMVNFIHPDDSEYVLQCEYKAQRYLLTVPDEDLFNYTVSYSYRSRTAYGHYICVKQNYQILALDASGRISRLLVFNEITDHKSRNAENDFRIFERTKSIELDMYQLDLSLTKRETEVFSLIKQGLTSVEISNKLHVSKFTIDTHRKNILAKAQNRKFITLVKQDLA